MESKIKLNKYKFENIKLKMNLIKALWLYSDRSIEDCRDALAEDDWDISSALIHMMRKDYFNTVTFPCRVGDTIYWVTDTDVDGTVKQDILEGKVESICIDDEHNRTWLNCRYDGGLTYSHCMDNNDDALFFKKEKAEEYLEFISNEKEKRI